MIFQYENAFYLLIIVAVVFIFCYIYLNKKEQKILNHFTHFKKMSSNLLKRSKTKIFLEILALVLIIFALARPKMGTTRETVQKIVGTDIMLAIDVSNSMLSNDTKPTRLALAKKTAHRIVDKLAMHRIGIIAFAGTATVISPLTNDILALKMYIDSISNISVDTQGTNWETALKLAHSRLEKSNVKKTVILISDGGINSGNKDKFSFLKKESIIVHTIGVGGTKKVPIPILNNGETVGYKKDVQGNTVLTKREDGLLKEISKTTDGKHYIASFDGSEIEKVVDNFSLTSESDEDTDYYSYNEWYQYFVALALLFILI